jgi:hypothetical protein
MLVSASLESPDWLILTTKFVFKGAADRNQRDNFHSVCDGIDQTVYVKVGNKVRPEQHIVLLLTHLLY